MSHICSRKMKSTFQNLYRRQKSKFYRVCSTFTAKKDIYSLKNTEDVNSKFTYAEYCRDF